MRTLGLGSKVILFVGAALALVGSLRLPWYGPSPEGEARATGERLPELGGPVEEFFGAAGRWFTDPNGADGYAMLQVSDTIFTVVAALSVVVAALLFVPAVEGAARTAAQALALLALGAAVVPFFDQPGNNALVEPRHGLLVAIAAALMLNWTASHLASARLVRAKARAMQSLHDSGVRRLLAGRG